MSEESGTENPKVDVADRAGDPIDDSGPRGWWKIMDMRIGIVPLPVFAVIVLLVTAYVADGTVPADLTTNILVLAAGGFACAEIGKHIPLLRKVGAAAILATFVPSLLVYLGAIPKPLQQ